MLPSAARESRIPFWAWIALPIMTAAWLRTRGIGGPEPFVDEAGNILSALDPRVRAVVDPLGQGRPALAHLFFPAGWLPGHALEVARLMSAGAGLATMVAIGWTLQRLAGRAASLCGLWLWAVMPFAVFHERLALQDSFVAALLAWAAALMVAGCQGQSKPPAPFLLSAGVLFGVGCLFKISAAFALPWLGLLFLAVQPGATLPRLGRALALIVLGAVLPLLCLGPDLFQLGRQSAQFGSLPDFGHGYWSTTAQRVPQWCGWYAGYGRWPLALLWAGALILAARVRSAPALATALGSALSLAVAALLYNRPFARYLMPDQVPLILFLALAWAPALVATGRRRVIATTLFAAAAGSWGFASWQISADTRRADIPADEIGQYFLGPWSGRGLHDVQRYLDDYATRHDVRCLVLTHRFMRPGCYGLMLAELGDPRIGVVPFTIYEPEELATARAGLRQVAAGRKVACFLLYEGSLYPAHPWLDQAAGPAKRVLAVPRGEGDAFTLYQFEP